MDDATTDAAAATILALLERRAPGRSICPSEAARALAPDDWRPLMPVVREAAARLRADGRLEVTRRGEAVDPLAPGGPIRLSLPPTA